MVIVVDNLSIRIVRFCMVVEIAAHHTLIVDINWYRDPLNYQLILELNILKLFILCKFADLVWLQTV
jgi:hypothetical protein